MVQNSSKLVEFGNGLGRSNMRIAPSIRLAPVAKHRLEMRISHQYAASNPPAWRSVAPMPNRALGSVGREASI